MESLEKGRAGGGDGERIVSEEGETWASEEEGRTKWLVSKEAADEAF
jgi:hypothetical protein